MSPPFAPSRLLIADPDETFARELELALAAEPTIELAGWTDTEEQTVELVSELAVDVVILAAGHSWATSTLQRLSELSAKPEVLLTYVDELESEVVAQMAGAAGFVRKQAEMSEMMMLVLALVAVANIRSVGSPA